MKYKEELFEHIFEVIANYYYQGDRFNYMSKYYIENNPEMKDKKTQEITLEQIKVQYGDFTTTDVLILSCEIENKQEDNIFDFNIDKIKIGIIDVNDIEAPYILINKKEPKYSSIIESIDLFVKQKTALIEKEIILNSMQGNSKAVLKNKKRI